MRSKTKAALIVCSTSAALFAAGWLGGCGGSSGDPATAIPEADAETSTDLDSGAPGIDSGTVPDGSTADGGCVEGTACFVNDSVPGLCKAGACTTCVDPTDDTACKKAYGARIDGGAAICSKGGCTAGNCHVNTDCAGNKICGLDTPNTCASCTADVACKTSYGSEYVCNKTTGGCETNTTACMNVDAGGCVGNAADICCAPTAGAGGACVPGNCCTSSQCSGGAPNCVNHTCTGCAAVADGVYWVDPTVSVSDDAIATGNKTDAKCAFRTITHALAAIGNAAAAPVTVRIVTGATTLGALEQFPIIVPTNVTIESANTAAPVTVLVPAGKEGFVLASPASALQYLTIDGQANAALHGVIAQTGSSATTTKLMHVTVKNFGDAGIDIRNAAGKATGGALAIGPGVTSTGNGTVALPAAGLHVHDNGIAVITGAAGDATHFDTNTSGGIRVEGLAQLTLTGEVGATPPTTGTVTTNGNGLVGLEIAQTPGAVPANAVTGLTSWNNTIGAGIRILAGSSLKLRSSSSLGNGTNGVHIKSSVSGAVVTNDTSKIDLGASAAVDPGKNVLQTIAGQSPNNGVGICLDIQPNVGQVVNAYGNKLVSSAVPPANVDCSTTAAQIKKNTGAGACAGGAALGVVGNAVNTDQVVTLLCTQ